MKTETLPRWSKASAAAMPPVWLIFVLPTAYFLAAFISISFFGTDTPIWASNAFAVAALLRNPRRTWPVLLALAACADYIALAITGTPVIAFGIISCDAFEISSVAFLVQLTGASALSESMWAMAKLAAICMLMPLISSTGGALLVVLSFGAPFVSTWLTWYLAVTCGLITVTPLLLAWTEKRVWQERKSQQAILKVLTIALAVGALGYLDFRYHLTGVDLSVPFLLLATFSGGLLGATTASVALAIATILVTMAGHGPIAVSAGSDTVKEIQGIQFFIVYILLIALPVGAILEQRQRLNVQLRERQRDVQRASQAKSDFLAVMSHEIRTPLTSVLGVADLLYQDDLSPRHRNYVKQIRSSGRYLLSLINDILDFSRLEAGKMEVETIDFEILRMIEPVRSQMAPLAMERHLTLRFELDNVPPLKGDPTKLRQILTNLIANAIKFTSQGAVTVTAVWQSTGAESGICRFEVRDTGIGIPAEKQAPLFDAFSQADTSTTRRYGGSGLGLAICKRLVEALGGTLGVESLSGVGSRFWFEAPMTLGEPTALEEPEKLGMMKRSPQRVLLAEDVETNRVLVTTMLRTQGYQVVAVETGEQALAAATDEDFDLILMDVNMPVMDGMEATRRIRTLPAPRGTVPILALTANVLPEDLLRYQAAGMITTITKPIDWQRLFDAMARYGQNGRAADAPHTGMSAVGQELREQLHRLDDGTGTGMRDIARLFIQDTQRRLSELGRMLEAADADGVAKLAHSIKGSAGNLGLRRLARLCGEIETVARAAELETVPGHLDDAEAEFAGICKVLAQLNTEPPTPCAS
jgi:two-component system, sensor histidine kinase